MENILEDIARREDVETLYTYVDDRINSLDGILRSAIVNVATQAETAAESIDAITGTCGIYAKNNEDLREKVAELSQKYDKILEILQNTATKSVFGDVSRLYFEEDASAD